MLSAELPITLSFIITLCVVCKPKFIVLLITNSYNDAFLFILSHISRNCIKHKQKSQYLYFILNVCWFLHRSVWEAFVPRFPAHSPSKTHPNMAAMWLACINGWWVNETKTLSIVWCVINYLPERLQTIWRKRTWRWPPTLKWSPTSTKWWPSIRRISSTPL